MPDIDLRPLSEAQRQTAQTLSERARLVDSVAASSAEITRLQSVAAQQARAGNAQAATAARAQLAQVTAARTADQTKIVATDDALRRIGDLLRVHDPCDADPALPLLLLPVRIETRFTADGKGLRVRAFPDDIHVDQHDQGLNADETKAWQAYWTSVWRANDDQAAAAWQALIQSVGKRRARWIAVGVPPTNLADRLTAGAPVFGPVTPRAKRAAVARLLPDRFVAVAFQGANKSTATGNSISAEVTVGLLADDGTAYVDVNGVKVLPGTEWLVDYATAENVGMALTVPLAVPKTKVDRLIVMGVRRSLDAARSASELERLLHAHQFTRGLAFVSQGTPTNNTEGDRAGWQSRAEAMRPSIDAPALPADGTNAQALATALGVDPRLFAGAGDAGLREEPHARAASVAFWNSTWGTFLDKINRVGENGAALSDSTIEAARVFHRDNVRGRGPLPAFRVGNQPYGVLPVSSLDSAWVPTPGDALEAKLLPMLHRVRNKWRFSLAGVPRVAPGIPNIDDVLKEVLGQSPVSGSLRVRTVLSEDAAKAGVAVSNADPNTLALETLIEDMLYEEILLDANIIYHTGSIATRAPQLALPMAVDADVAYMDALLTRAATQPKITSVWQALLQLSWARADREVFQTGAGRFTEVITFATGIPQADRDRVIATASNASKLGSAPLRAEADRMRGIVLANKATPTLAEFQPIVATRKGFGELTLTATTDSARSSLAAYAAWAYLEALARQAELREAVTDLRNTTTDERKILLAETLDCASHRLDAWLTAIVEKRRKQGRATTSAGLAIGAYGWVEDIDPSATGNRPGDGGYVLAPSLGHAATAGILRSAYLSHNTVGGTGAFAVDLTSARVRTALHLIEGIRGGQSLSALLGYRIERAMHDAKMELDRFILSLRTIAPLTQGRLTDRGENVPTSAIESLAASNVVDGVDLIEKFQGKVATWDQNRVFTALNTRPTNNPYLPAAEPWPALTAPQTAAVTQIIQDAAQACDAVADLMMTEGVHQLVMGNWSRATAALDAAAGAEAPPPDPHVIRTPIEGIPIAHRVMIVAGAGAPWNAGRPRAAAEPRLEAWAGARLGDPSKIFIADGAGGPPRTFADTGLCALDVIYDGANRTLLEQRVRAALSLQPDAVLFDSPVPAWPAGTRAFGDVVEHAAALRSLLASARPAAPSDLARSADTDTRTLSRTELDTIITRATVAQGGLRAIVIELAAGLAANPLNEAALRVSLERAAAYGVVAPIVSGEQLTTVASAAQAEADRRVKEAEVRLDDARTAMKLPDSLGTRTTAREAVIAVGKILFGDGFWLVPALDAPAQPDLWQLALAPGALSVRQGDIRRFLSDIASVREIAKRMSDTVLLAEAVGQPVTLRVAQLVTPGTPTAARWVGGPLDPATESPQEPVANCIIDAPAGYDGTGSTVALVVDQWTDVVPVRERRGADANAPIDERATTGVAFNANASSARAPQAVLLAVSPDGKRWTSDALLQTLIETIDLAKLRLVTLEKTLMVSRVIPAIYAQSWSLQGEPAMDFSYFTPAVSVLPALAAHVKE